MKISRDWATPLTIGAFGLMAVTGILMFFHLDSGLNKVAHEWLGWLMVAGVAAHAAANWPAFKRHILSSTPGRAILVVSILVTAASFAQVSGKAGADLPPPVMAMKAVTAAPISAVAALADKPVDRLLDDLEKAGIRVSGPDATLASAIAGNRELEGRAMRVVFGRGR